MQVRIAGECDERFALVREAFAANFAQHGELGAAITLYLEGRKVIDLWGGYRDLEQTRLWDANTLVAVFSVGKAMATLAVLDCVARGELDFDAPIARYWPEFAAQGKAAISLRMLLSHRAGLPAFRDPLPPSATLDVPCIVRALECQAPWWHPGEAHGYHVNTFGYMLGEIVRRASGATIGRRLGERVFGPLAADVHLGLAEADLARTADYRFPEWDPPSAESMLNDQQLMRRNAYANPSNFSGTGLVNSRAWRQLELPHQNMHASARGVARVYAALATHGSFEGCRVVEPELLREATRQHSGGVDLVLDRPSRFGLGFQLTQAERALGTNPGAFGHFGAGGSLGFCDPEARLGFGYVMNDMGPRWQNPRNRALIDSVYACL